MGPNEGGSVPLPLCGFEASGDEESGADGAAALSCTPSRAGEPCDEGVWMRQNNIWIFVTIAVIWLVVLITSLRSPELMFGTEPVQVKIAAIANWFWGLLGTVFLLRSTIFRRPDEVGWGQDVAWPWVAGVVSAIWVVAALVSLAVPDIVVSEDIVVPAAAIVAPVVAAGLTLYVTEFLVTGFAARQNVGGV